MENDAYEDLNPDVRAAALPIRAELVKAGWRFSVTEWKDREARTAWFRMVSPTGVPHHVLCAEAELPARLSTLLNPAT